MRTLRIVSTFLILGSAAAVQGSDASTQSSSVRYHVQGVLLSIDQEHASVRIKHETIPGYMPAMTMDFSVRVPQELAKLKSGDAIEFDLRTTATDAWIEHVERIGSVSFSAPLQNSGSAELPVGSPLPDTRFETSTGAPMTLQEWRGKVVALTFFYGRCPLPTYCPLLQRNFQRAIPLAAALLPRNSYAFCSVSFDPRHDSTAALTDLGRAYGADEKVWTFVHADLSALTKLSASVGLEVRPTADAFDHNLRTVVIDAHGRLYRVFKGNTWTAQELAAAMRSALKTS